MREALIGPWKVNFVLFGSFPGTTVLDSFKKLHHRFRSKPCQSSQRPFYFRKQVDHCSLQACLLMCSLEKFCQVNGLEATKWLYLRVSAISKREYEKLLLMLDEQQKITLIIVHMYLSPNDWGISSRCFHAAGHVGHDTEVGLCSKACVQCALLLARAPDLHVDN